MAGADDEENERDSRALRSGPTSHVGVQRTATVDGVTLVFDTGDGVSRVTLRRRAFRRRSAGAVLHAVSTCGILLLTLGLALGLLLEVVRADPSAGSRTPLIVGIVALVGIAALGIRVSAHDALHRVCGTDEIRLESGVATVRRTSLLRTDSASFSCKDTGFLLSPAPPGGCLTGLYRLGGGEYPLGRIGPIRVDGTSAEWECRIGAGVSARTAAALLAAAGADQSLRLSVVPGPAIDN